ncbi:MAG: metallophosphoesterase family protein [Methanobrevibacter sp.]|nr:metallophosphoesterase family protein [Methanobrevibacter sp.]
MKFIHIADIHASRERLPQTLHILKTLTKRCKEGDIDFILFAGDFWDSTITATKGSGFSDIISAVRELEKYTYLCFVYGTPTHEPKGSLDAFQSDRTFVYDKNCSVLMGAGKTDETASLARLVIIPEPRRSDYIKASAEKINDSINSEIKEFIHRTALTPTVSDHTIVMYHGEVKGAVYQNGVSASSPTAIPKELLESLNADYYALGHIHIPQEVFPNAWYPGSAYPKNFGETHNGCYNLVDITDGKTTVEQVSFGLPTYHTIYKRPSEIKKGNFFNTHIRFMFDCTREERKQMNIKALADELKTNLNALSVKIEANVIDSENVKRSEITKHKSIVEKMDEYVKEMNLKTPKYAKELLQNIQDNTLINFAYPQHSFELLSLSLRGAIGIRNGQHKEEFELNFETLEDGVVCLCGANGHGKSTVLENCHPYPKMLSRAGTLKDHFYLKDSHRILVYKDENELYYKITMLIDGKTANGKTSYFVSTSKDRNVWHPLPEVDGSLDSYKDWVNKTFGNIDVFLRTAFFAKEQTKDAVEISETTKGERMELLSKLAGTDHLKEVSVIAREQKKEIEKQIEKLETEINSFSGYETLIEENEKNILMWKAESDELKGTITTLEEILADLRKEDAEYQKIKVLEETNKALCEQYYKEMKEKQEELDELSECNKANFDKAKEYKDCIDSNELLLQKENEKLDKDRKTLMELSEELVSLTKKHSELISQVDRMTSNMDLCKSRLLKTDGLCPTCGSPLSTHKLAEFETYNAEVQLKYDEYLKERVKVNALVSQNEQESSRIQKKVDELKLKVSETEEYIISLVAERTKYSDFLDAFNDIYLNSTYEEVYKRKAELEKDIKTLSANINDIHLDSDLEDVSEELAEKEAEYKEYKESLNELTSSVKAAEKENAHYKKELDKTEEKKAEIKDLKEKVMAYLFIENTFSNNGIPAIELRESAPEIADITNKILRESYGNKFEVRFGSSSELKANRKANEDFNIIVYDSENDDEKTIDLVSSGERIWIKQALFYAFSIVQMNRTGFNFRTRLIDESDGSLDGALRPKYLQMVESAHKYSDSRVTILITHSQEIKDIAQQVIEI